MSGLVQIPDCGILEYVQSDPYSRLRDILEYVRSGSDSSLRGSVRILEYVQSGSHTRFSRYT